LTLADSVDLDLRLLPQVPPQLFERPERQPPAVTPMPMPGSSPSSVPNLPSETTASAPAPSPTANFAGQDFYQFGNGHPPDTNGDAGPVYYIQTINTAVGVYRKSDGFRVAQFPFNALMGQGHFGNLCDTNNYGDPVVLYDTFEDRWILTDFAFQLSGNDVVNPPGSYQCFAVSKTGDPVSGGWNFYSINTAGGFGDYPKFGIWPDGLYMSANMFDYKWSGSFQKPRLYALNKAQMYAGRPTIQVVSFDAPDYEFTILPANARLQVGAPPAGSPNYCAVIWNYTTTVSLYKFHVDWNKTYQSSFTGPFYSSASTSWTDPPYSVPALNGSSLDTVSVELMAQNQYTNQNGVESVWLSHTVAGAGATAAPRYYQVNVTGGGVAASTAQAFTHAPDATMNRFMSSLAVDRAGDMAIGYSTSSATSYPAIKYAGRLATDPPNSLPQTEVSLIDGTGSQTSTNRWGDYSAMTLDPDGCRFWYTNMYYATTGLNFLTRIGAFAFPSCTPLANSGTLQGTVTAAAGGAPVSGASITLGARSATTDASGFYSFGSIPAGTYPALIVSKPGYVSQTSAPIVMADSGPVTRDFALTAAAVSACFNDTQADFQNGVATPVAVLTTSRSAIHPKGVITDQQGAATLTMIPFDSTNWAGQTFLGSHGSVDTLQVNKDCLGCTGTRPDITVSIRAADGDLPTGPDLATGTISGSDPYAYQAHLSPPLILTAGARYATVIRPVSNPSAGTYEYAVASSPYENGRCVTSTDSGASWIGTNYDAGIFAFISLYQTSITSGLKDSNPAAGLTPIWSTLSWTATTPANTWVEVQIAASNSEYGPFDFAGPDGTSSTYYTSSGVPLSQFYGLRYLKYKVRLSSAVSGVISSLTGVTLCYDNVACSLPVPTISGPTSSCGGSSITLTSSSATGNQWLLNSAIIEGATNSSYVATASGSYSVRVTGAAGCRATSAIRQITISTPITVNPASVNDSTVGIAYDVPLSATGGTGSFTFSGQSLPPGLQVKSGPWPESPWTLTGSPSSPGTYTITITATDANHCTGSRDYTFTFIGQMGTAPANLRATANGTSQVNVTWTAVAYATGYEVLRNGFVVGSPVSNGFVDTQGIVPGTAYVYRVRSLGPNFPAIVSAPDIATTIVFTDDPLVIGSTVLKGVHLTEVRAAVNAVRAVAGLGAATFTDASPSGKTPKALYIQQLREALDPARFALGLPTMTYSKPANVGSLVRAIDLTEIRNGVK
jgi:hypothetical protein